MCAVDTQTGSEDYLPALPDLESPSTLQEADDEIALMLTYLIDGELAEDRKKAQKIVLESQQFSVLRECYRGKILSSLADTVLLFQPVSVLIC